MITENAVVRTALGTAAGAAVVTEKISHFHMFEDANELKFVLWAVGGLLAIISILLGVIAYFIKDMRASNTRHHGILYAKVEKNEDDIDKTNTKLAGLRGQHDASFNAQGCAWDATRLQDMIDRAVEKALENQRGKHRKTDCQYCGKEKECKDAEDRTTKDA